MFYGGTATRTILGFFTAISIVAGVQATDTTASAKFVNTEGQVIGEAQLQQGATGVLIKVRVEGLEPGAHAIHIHSVGKCEPDFKASAGHVHSDKKVHGLLNPDGPDSGDLPNIYVGNDGTATAEFFTTRVSINDRGQEGIGIVLDADGSALVIHANADDHVTQPIGGAGDRVACGAIVGV